MHSKTVSTFHTVYTFVLIVNVDHLCNAYKHQATASNIVSTNNKSNNKKRWNLYEENDCIFHKKKILCLVLRLFYLLLFFDTTDNNYIIILLFYQAVTSVYVQDLASSVLYCRLHLIFQPSKTVNKSLLWKCFVLIYWIALERTRVRKICTIFAPERVYTLRIK